MNNILDYTISSIFDIPSFFIKDELINSITIKNCFGIFVTIKRSKKQQLLEYPYDIHGCIGRYDINPNNILDNETILNNIISSAKSAVYEDDRSKYYKEPLFLDSDATIELSLMKTPLLDINNINGLINGELTKPFNNEEYGIIVINETTNKTATFLPKVFNKNTSWDDIKKHLLEKANIESGIFKAYKIEKYEKKLFNIINTNYINKIFRNISEFFNKNYNEHIPFAIIKSKENNDIYNILFSKEEDVRNIATLNDLIEMDNKVNLLNINVIKNIERDIDYYIKRYNNDEEIVRQALSFLILVNKNKEISNSICNKLLTNINNMERDFELGQALIAIIKCGDNNDINVKKIIKNNINNMMLDLLNRKSYNINDVFRINWQTKALITYFTINKNKSEEDCVDHFNLLINIITDILTDSINRKQLSELETNYLAVCFECLSSIYKYEKNNSKINNYIFYIFLLLQSRFSIFGLYMFNDHTARIDITGHCVEGFVQYFT